MRLAIAVLFLFSAASALAGQPADYVVATEVLIRSGDPSPDGNGIFGDELGPPLLNNSGQVAVWSKLLATTNPDPIDDYGLYRVDTLGAQTLVRGGAASAAGNLLRLDVLRVSSLIRRALFGIDRLGRVAFIADDDDLMDAIYLADGNTIQVLIQEGETTAFGDNVQLGPAVLGFLMNNEGDLAYQVSANPNNVMIRSDASGHEVIFTQGQNLPGGGVLTGFRAFAMNDLGQVAARLNTSSTSFGYFVGDGQTTDAIMQTGEPAPDGLGSFTTSALYPTDINNNSDVSMVLGVDDVAMDYVGLFLGSSTNITEVNRTGDATFEGLLRGYIAPPLINDAGSMVYAMVSDNTNIERLVLRRSGNDTLLVSAGDVLPPPIDLTIVTLTGWTMNGEDQIAFSANVFKSGVPAATAIFFYDPDFGMATVAEVGQSFGNGTITALNSALPFYPFETNRLGNPQTGMNDNGQIAFAYTLDTGEVGIALAEVVFPRDENLFSDGFESLTVR